MRRSIAADSPAAFRSVSHCAFRALNPGHWLRSLSLYAVFLQITKWRRCFLRRVSAQRNIAANYFPSVFQLSFAIKASAVFRLPISCSGVTAKGSVLSVPLRPAVSS